MMCRKDAECVSNSVGGILNIGLTIGSCFMEIVLGVGVSLTNSMFYKYRPINAYIYKRPPRGELSNEL